jgi:hypothetical protein
MNALIVIDLHGNLDAMDLMHPFFYPLEAENRLYWVKKQRMADIGADVLSWLRKYQILHFNIAVLTGLPLSTQNDTLTNQFYRFQQSCMSLLEEQQLRPNDVFVITLDGLRRDGINGKPKDDEQVKSWEMDTQGFVNESVNDDFRFNVGHLKHLDDAWKAPFDFANETIDLGLDGLSVQKREQVQQSFTSVKFLLDQMIDERIQCIGLYKDNDRNVLDFSKEKYSIIHNEFHDQLKGLETHVGQLNSYMPGAALNALLRRHLGLGFCCEKSILIYMKWHKDHGQIPVKNLIALTQLLLLISQQRAQTEGLGRCEYNQSYYYRLQTNIDLPHWRALINSWHARLQNQEKLFDSESPPEYSIDYYPIEACDSINLTALDEINTKPWPIPTWQDETDDSKWQEWISGQACEIRKRQQKVQDNIDELSHQLDSPNTIEKKKITDIASEIMQICESLKLQREGLQNGSHIATPGSYEQLVQKDNRLLRISLKTRPSKKTVFLSLLVGTLIMASAYSAGLAGQVNVDVGLPMILPLMTLSLVGFFVLLPVSIIRKNIDIIARRCHTLALNIASQWSNFQKKEVDRLKALYRLKLATQNLLNIEDLDNKLQKQAKLKNYHRQLVKQHKELVETLANQLSIQLDSEMEFAPPAFQNSRFDISMPQWKNSLYWPIPDTSPNSVSVNIGNTSDSLNISWVSGITFELKKTELVQFGRE